mgnify:CR=1 FL=1
MVWHFFILYVLDIKWYLLCNVILVYIKQHWQKLNKSDRGCAHYVFEKIDEKGKY